MNTVYVRKIHKTLRYINAIYVRNIHKHSDI